MSRLRMQALGGRALYQVSCPRCTHAFDVPANAGSARCPRCATEMDLVSESVASTLGIDPRRGVVQTPETRRPPSQAPRAVPEWAQPTATARGTRVVKEEDEDLVEIPCPVCEGPLLVSPRDREGVCPHCERELEFEVELGPAGTQAPSARFGPEDEITPRDAPLVEVGTTPPFDEVLGPSSGASIVPPASPGSDDVGAGPAKSAPKKRSQRPAAQTPNKGAVKKKTARKAVKKDA